MYVVLLGLSLIFGEPDILFNPGTNTGSHVSPFIPNESRSPETILTYSRGETVYFNCAVRFKEVPPVDGVDMKGSFPLVGLCGGL